jgi:hypothetical protein
MPRVNVYYELDQEYLFEDHPKEYEIEHPKQKGKHVKISERVFDLMKSEGLIKKTNEGYIFVGKNEDLKAFKKKKP